MTAPATGRTAVRRTPRTRRALALLAPLLLLLGTLAGCTGGGGPGPEDTAHDEPGDIVVASGRDVTGKNGIRQRLIDAWNREHQDDGFRARLVELPAPPTPSAASSSGRCSRAAPTTTWSTWT